MKRHKKWSPLLKLPWAYFLNLYRRFSSRVSVKTRRREDLNRPSRNSVLPWGGLREELTYSVWPTSAACLLPEHSSLFVLLFSLQKFCLLPKNILVLQCCSFLSKSFALCPNIFPFLFCSFLSDQTCEFCPMLSSFVHIAHAHVFFQL